MNLSPWRRSTRWPLRRSILAASACFALAACGEAPQPAAPDTAPAAKVAPPTQAESLAPEVARLLAEGNTAFAASQFVTPPGESALERYIAARQLDPAHQGVQEALVEVFPMGVAAAERALEDGNRQEAARIIALLQRASPDSLPVRALRDRLAGRPAETAGAGDTAP